MLVNNKVLQYIKVTCALKWASKLPRKTETYESAKCVSCTTVSVPITTRNGFVSDLPSEWALKWMFYATGPWFLNIILAKSQDVIVNLFKTILQYSVWRALNWLKLFKEMLWLIIQSVECLFSVLVSKPQTNLFWEKKIAAPISALYILKPSRPRTRTSFHIKVH